MLQPVRAYQRPNASERRKASRFSSDRVVKFTQIGTGEILNLSRISDVSDRGLKLMTHEPLPPKTVLKFDFVGTHDVRPFSIKGVVIWSRLSSTQENTFYSGVVFLYAPRHAANIIRGIVSPS